MSYSPSHKFLNQSFLTAMNEIGEYGHSKYGLDSFQHRVHIGDRSRWMGRVEAEQLAGHAAEHFQMHLRGELHDHFNTRRHQLAAVAFNAMMEFYLSGLDMERDA